jgi:hypothetical protein
MYSRISHNILGKYHFVEGASTENLIKNEDGIFGI